MLTPEQIAALRDAAGRIADSINDFLLDDIARRISEAGQLTSTAAYQVWRAQQLGLSQREIKRKLREILVTTNAEINRLTTQAAETGYRFDLERLPTAAAISFEENRVLQQTVAAAVSLAQEDFTNLTQTLGMVDSFGRPLPLQEAYRSSMDFAFQQVFTGVADYNTALRKATKNLADLGVRVIGYESGVHTSLEAAARRNILGGLGLMQERIAQQNHDELGADGWEITAHANSAPDHEPIQGRQYSDAQYKALNASLVRRIGTLNCGHAAFPIILGVSSPQYTPEELEKFRADNARGITYQGRHYTGYEATQMQRKIETAMRRQKRRILVDEAAGDTEKLQTDRIRLRRLSEEYKRFSKTAGLRTEPERAMVAGFGRGQAEAAGRTVAKYSAIHYNKDGTIVVTDDWTGQEHPRIPARYIPNAVVDTQSQSGRQHDRTIYGPDGRTMMQIHGGDHGHPKQHQYGQHGEHVHDFTWHEGVDKPDRTTRAATDDERGNNFDILGGDDDDS